MYNDSANDYWFIESRDESGCALSWQEQSGLPGPLLLLGHENGISL